MQSLRLRWLYIVLAIFISAGCTNTKKATAPSGELARGFVHPPQSARPHTWWHWVSGNVSKEGITADLEAMNRIGLGGLQAFSVDQGPKPEKPVLYMSPEWRELMKHAVAESVRLNLALTMHACEGW